MSICKNPDERILIMGLCNIQDIAKKVGGTQTLYSGGHWNVYRSRSATGRR
jgi:hypothetical protein